MKVTISQPMRGKTDEEIVETRNKAIIDIEKQGHEVVNTLFTDKWYNPEKMIERGVINIPLVFLAKSVENMSKCDAIYFCEGWDWARGCLIEHHIALTYGLTIIYNRAWHLQEVNRRKMLL